MDSKTDSSDSAWASIPSWPLYEANAVTGEIRRVGSLVAKTPTPNGDGYLVTSVSGPSGSKTCLVHRLVAEAHIGDIAGRVVHHTNGCRQDARAVNLAVMTQAENVRRSHADGTASCLAGESRPEAWGRSGGYLTAEQVRALRRARASGKRGAVAELAREYGVRYNVADAAARGARYPWVGDTSLATDLHRQEVTAVRDARKVAARLKRARAARAANPKHSPPAPSARPRFARSEGK